MTPKHTVRYTRAASSRFERLWVSFKLPICRNPGQFQSAVDTGEDKAVSWRMKSVTAVAAALAITLAANAAHAEMMKAIADMKDPNGKDVGTVELTESPNGVLLTAKLKNLPAGTHAFHVHAVGKCEPPFKSAGGHYNPGGKKHGIIVQGGMHAGDMPNIHVPSSGELTIEVLNPNVTLAKGKPGTVFDGDGSAIVLHEKGDDYKSQPSGAAGSRIGCGVIK